MEISLGLLFLSLIIIFSALDNIVSWAFWLCNCRKKEIKKTIIYRWSILVIFLLLLFYVQYRSNLRLNMYFGEKYVLLNESAITWEEFE